MAGDRKVLAKRVTDETVIGQQSAQVFVSFEHDAIQVKRLTLVPVGGVPERVDRGHDGHVVIGRKNTHPQATVVGDGQQVRNHGKTRAVCQRRVAIAIGAVVHAAQVHELLETQVGVVSQGLHHSDVIGRRHHQGGFAQRLGQHAHALAQHGL